MKVGWETLDRIFGILGELSWIGLAVPLVLLGLVLGPPFKAGLGRRGNLHAAITAGLTMNVMAKAEDESYLVAFLLMVAVTVLTLAVGYVNWGSIRWSHKPPSKEE